MAEARVYRIQGRDVRMPVVVRDASAGSAMFMVPAAAAQTLVPGDAFRVIETEGGETQLVLVMVDYRDNDLGDYDEVGIVLFVRPADAGLEAAGSYIHRLPVNQSFTQEAGLVIWGFPKTIEQIEIATEAERARCRLDMDGQHVFTLTVPRVVAEGDGDPMPQVGYTFIDGVPHVTRSTMQGATSVTPGGDEVELELGGHPLARQLAELGLPKAPVLSSWTEHQRLRFEAPEKL
jgi:hypothetical protein